MGQYHTVVNLDKRERLEPHRLGTGLKLWEQLASAPGTGAALVILLASASNGAGGGDLTGGPIIGRWRGDRIAFVGDYDGDSSYVVGYGPEQLRTFLDGAIGATKDHWQTKPQETMTGDEIYNAADWLDVTDDVCAVIEAELDGKFMGGGWRTWTPNDEAKAEA